MSVYGACHNFKLVDGVALQGGTAYITLMCSDHKDCDWSAGNVCPVQSGSLAAEMFIKLVRSHF